MSLLIKHTISAIEITWDLYSYSAIDRSAMEWREEMLSEVVCVYHTVYSICSIFMKIMEMCQVISRNGNVNLLMT